MYTKQEEPEERGFWVGLVLLAIGVAIGVLLPESARPWKSARSSDAPARLRPADPEVALDPVLVHGTATEGVPDNGLDSVAFELPPESAAVLQRVRDRALERGLITKEEGDVVPADVIVGDRRVEAEVRIKGDWLDHVALGKWSLRVKLKGGELFGMSTFSVQAPETRGMLWEWLVLAVGRREGLLAPRSRFVNVVVNGNPNGIYYLEEHFSKEMLESQGRRDGPIVLWDESTHWTTRQDAHMVGEASTRTSMPSALGPGLGLQMAPARAYETKRLSESETLSRSLHAALSKMDDLKTLMLTRRGPANRAWVIDRMAEVQREDVESILDLEQQARCHALLSLFQVHHALSWHNLRFYHDPVLDRLEPILFDNNAQVPSDRAPVPLRGGDLLRGIATSRAYYDGVFAELGRICRPEWLDEVFLELGPELRRYERALDQETPLRPGSKVPAIRQRLRAQQSFLRRVLYPSDPVNFQALYRDEPGSAGDVEVIAWATTKTPVLVEGFRFSNGTFVSAASSLVEGSERVTVRRGGVVLSYDGSTSLFRFPLDARLAGLASAKSLVRSVEEGGAETTTPPAPEVEVVFHAIATDAEQAEPLVFRRYDPAWDEEGGRPDEPELEAVLRRHGFLHLSSETGALVVRPGTWDVVGDLVIPSHASLFVGPGTTLRFEEGAALVSSSPLLFRGSSRAPIVLEPIDSERGWRGVVVLRAGERSEWAHVTVRAADALSRQGWVVTGGITFYRSAVTLTDCRIEGARAEDGLNVFGTDLVMRRVLFEGCASDSFDGDFVTAEIVECTFQNGQGDGADFSGSEARIVDCRFLDLGDKAISAGEASRCTITSARIDGVAIGVAAKDGSEVTLERSSIRRAAAFGLAVFVKKPEFGPAKLVANEVSLEECGLGRTLAQDGCELLLDGKVTPTQDLDVETLYREKVLGR